MAQPVFDDHPLEVYLREIGEAAESMPGGSPEFCRERDDESSFAEVTEDDNVQLLPTFFLGALDILNSMLSLAPHPSPFVEHFKYNVISSSLLSSDFTPPHSRHQTSFNLPGRLSSGHSRGPSTESSTVETSSAGQHPAHDLIAEDVSRTPVTIAFAAVLAIYCMGYYTLAALALGIALYCFHRGRLDSVSKPAMTSSLGTLKDLIAAGDVWDSAVHEAMSMLESEEQSIFYNPINPISPSSPVRVTLQSSLHTTQTQCDNVRQLFSALTSPSELSQLSEMYAPPSPMKTGSPSPDPFDYLRPLSSPASHNRSHSSPSQAKRSTWNGSYSTLASAGSPTMQVLKRREKRRSDLSSLVEPTSPMRSNVSAPMTLELISSGLTGVQEEDDSSPDPNLSFSSEVANSRFGIDALDLQRRRKTGGIEMLGLLPPGRRSSTAPSNIIMPASRFTTIQTTRHPLSLSALNRALQSAVASKRYACSHLLALRFNEEEDEGYWEDVRSVMSLLTTTFVDASERLAEALEEVEKQKLQDQTPSLPSHSRNVSSSFSIEDEMRPPQMMAQMTSFAPMPSHLSRFAAHVDAISSALNDAREHLEQCVASLREHPNEPDCSRSPSPESQRETPLQAYERMRRELGLALRECERGRERLLHILSPARHIEDPDSADDVPALGHDAASDESDKPDSTPDVPASPGPVGFSLVPQEDGEVDDVTSHLLLTASTQHLPPQGIEQVFEADSGAEMLFSRGRSKLTREERIQMVKARRASGGVGLGVGFASDPPGSKPGIERWGPGGEVVQELKDVIWKVGERRRRMTERQFAFSTET